MEAKKLIPVVLAIATVVVHVVFAIWASNAPPYISGSCGFLGDPVCPEDMDPEAVDIYGRLVLWGWRPRCSPSSGGAISVAQRGHDGSGVAPKRVGWPGEPA